jgi:hypothetical protein
MENIIKKFSPALITSFSSCENIFLNF